MSLKKFLILPLLLSLFIFIAYSGAVDNSFHQLTASIGSGRQLIGVLLLAVVLQLAGHIVRAKKAELLFDPVKKNTTRFQFRALSIGYMFNTLLPLRIGELIRSRIIAGAFDLSFGLVLTLVIVERAVDATILGLVGLILLCTLGITQGDLLAYAIGLLVVAVLVALAVTMIMNQQRLFLRWCHKVTGFFRDDIKHSIRFKIWSIIYGLQRTITRQQFTRYIGLSLLSWLFYGLSVYVLVQHLLEPYGVGHKILASFAPYFGISLPAGPADLGVFSRITNSFTHSLHLSANSALVFDLLAWATLIIPIAVLGVILLFTKTKETLWRRVPRRVSEYSLTNKLYRVEDISLEMASFLEHFFAGNSLSRIVHKLELQDDFRLVKYFKGGSDAITILALQDGKQVVKKIIPLEFENRLKAQYDWLKQRGGKNNLVGVLAEQRTDNFYAIDIDYEKTNDMFYEYIHRKPLIDSQLVLNKVVSSLYKGVYGKPTKPSRRARELDAYINTHIFECLNKAATIDPELVRAVESDTITINGKQYDNLYQVIEKIKNHPQAWKDITTYQCTATVHGDVIVDNLLVSRTTNKPLIIDPAPDGNIVNGPVFDFGKLMQSLYCGYEFLLRDEDPVFLVDQSIDYRVHNSDQYVQLCEYVRNQLAPKYLSPGEQKAILFHAAALYIRRLKHQVYYTPANVLKFYAVGVKTLNDFLAQYD